jgi:hypothetical protein
MPGDRGQRGEQVEREHDAGGARQGGNLNRRQELHLAVREAARGPVRRNGGDDCAQSGRRRGKEKDREQQPPTLHHGPRQCHDDADAGHRNECDNSLPGWTEKRHIVTCPAGEADKRRDCDPQPGRTVGRPECSNKQRNRREPCGPPIGFERGCQRHKDAGKYCRPNLPQDIRPVPHLVAA